VSGESRFVREIRDYLADCEAAPGLSPKYHPTAEGAVKVIFHRGKDEESQIRAVFTQERRKRRT
jgi:hypothetical protein